MKPIRQAVAWTVLSLAMALPLAASAAPVYLHAGSMVTSKINETVDSGSAQGGDKFTMTVVAPYPNNNGAYDNAHVYGHVTHVVRAGQGQNPTLEFAIDRIALVNGRQAPVSMMLQSHETQRHNNMGNVAMTAAAGMILGNMIGKTLFKSNLGGAAGLAAGALYANNKRTNVSMRSGSLIVMEVRHTVALTRAPVTASRH
ncbi:MAG: hypothetical protein GIW99_10835 [Candidatus Eremiobacteraeota bacterium]|nr:hypothetical protein [Candidatus Eremiobacteraeota bacterium]MBC5828157.1 hypothetical protein [Candidatus Eremiobacteraeota bacterium]